MKLTKFVCTLLLLSHLPSYGADIQSIDIELDSLNLTVPEGLSGPAGEMSFKSLDFYSSDIFLNLYDEGEVFDSSIYLRPDFFGIRGKNHALGVTLDASGLATIKNLKFGRTSFGFNSQKISLESERMEIEQEDIDLDIKNARFFCKKDPNHPGMDLEAIKYGCLSYSSFNGLDDENPVEIAALVKATDEDGEDMRISSQIKHVEFRKEKIYMNSPATSIDLSNDMNVSLSNLRLACNKNGNLDQFDPNKLILDCIDDVSFRVEDIVVDGKLISEETGEESKVDMALSKPEIALEPESLNVKTEKVSFEAGTMNGTFQNIFLRCNKDNNQISNKDFNGIIASCLDTSHLEKLNNQSAHLNFNQQTEAFGDVNLKANVEVIDFEKGDLKTSLDDFFVTLGSDIKIGSHKLDLSCETNFELPKSDELKEGESYLDRIDVDKSIESCMNQVKIPHTKLFVQNTTRKGRYFLDINSVNLQREYIRFNIPGIQFVSEEGSTTVLGLTGNCMKDKDASVSDYKKVIKGCATNSQFSIKKLIGDEDNDEFENIFDHYIWYIGKGTKNTPIDLVKNHDPSLQTINVTVKDGVMRARLYTEVLFSNREVVIEGKLSYSEDSEKLVVDITKTQLPFGINNKKFSLWLIKKFVADDNIKVSPSSKTITIDLKFN